MRCDTIIRQSRGDRGHRHIGRERGSETADVILAIGTRLQDFTTGSWALFQDPARLIGLNVQLFDASEASHALPLLADARAALVALDAALGAPPRARRLARRFSRALGDLAANMPPL